MKQKKPADSKECLFKLSADSKEALFYNYHNNW